MQAVDWIVFSAFLIYVVLDGLRHARANRTSDDYFLAGRSARWWVMGLSIMATQASAITLVSTTGFGWRDGMEFMQFYLGVPIAMAILAFTLVPLYHRLKVFTAYEYLGQRFDAKTRWLSALLFVVLRSLSLGVVVYAPSVILALLFGWPVWISVIVMGAIATAYTSLGGMNAVLRTDVKQMTIMTLGLGVAFVTILRGLPEGVGLTESLQLADAVGHLEILSFEWDPSSKYTVWSALCGGTLLFLAYFGTDQSQAQRYLSGRSLRDNQAALGMNALLKLPFQGLVLVTGVLLMVFYAYQAHPVSFLPVEPELDATQSAQLMGLDVEYEQQRQELAQHFDVLRANPDADPSAAKQTTQAMASTRKAASNLYAAGGISHNEVNYVFPHFILHYLPVGIAGLLLAAILAAALSSIDSELNALATVTVKDLVPLGEGGEGQSLTRGRIATILWGTIASVFALTLAGQKALVEQVNQIGSYFYGSLLGVFALAFFPRANGTGAVLGMISGMLAVGIVQLQSKIAFLYLNAAAAGTTIVVGLVVSELTRKRDRETTSD